MAGKEGTFLQKVAEMKPFSSDSSLALLESTNLLIFIY